MWIAAMLVWPNLGHADNFASDVRKAALRSTLDQTGTKPFHLKATLTPSFERDKDSGRIGEVEIWWASPAEWRREVRAPQFHEIAIANSGQEWQKNDGDYFPEWLRETANELIRPIPPLEEVVRQIGDSEARRIGPMTNFTWEVPSGTADVPNIYREWVALDNNTGLLLYAGGLGWGAEFKDYANFHGRMVAHTINVGSPQVTAKVTTLEDLGEVPTGFFDVSANGGDTEPIDTVLIDETSLRKNLLPVPALSWPPIQDGPLEGHITTDVVLDREGSVREIGALISDNPGLDEAAKQALEAMRFTPFVANGKRAQVMSQITLTFKTVRPPGAETFESARTYFERGRRVGFPAFGGGVPYSLRAEFQARGSDGSVQTGRYEDTCISASQWRREAWFGNSRFVRARNGDKWYQFGEGPESALLQLVFRVLEPIPATDTFVESDWRIKRDSVNGILTVRVLSGYESPEGELDPEQARGYWFNDDGLLVKTHFGGIESLRSDFEDFDGVKVARQIDILKDGKLRMLIRVKEISHADLVPDETFEVPGHEWTRAFTDQVR